LRFDALDPRGEEPPVRRTLLAERPGDLDGARLQIILTMPPGSGLEAVEAEVRGHLGETGASTELTTFRRRDFMIDDPAERERVVAGCDAAVLVVGPTVTTAAVTAAYAAGLEAAGLPVVLLLPAPVRAAAEQAAYRSGAALRITEQVADVARELTAPLTESERRSGTISPPPRPEIACSGSLEEVLEHFTAQGWTDGLPIVPPTAQALDAMLTGTSRDAGELVTATLRPEGLPARVREVAIAAIMAGAQPRQLPIILAAAEVLGDIEFQSMTRSVNSFAFAYLVNGPVAAAAGLTGGLGAIGPGHRANAAVGRALGLLTRTAGGARLGVTVAPTMGNPAAWAFAFAENEAASPFAPLHTCFGFGASDSTVSVFTGGWSHLGNFYYEGVDGVVEAMSRIDALTGVLLFVSAKRAAALAAEGWTRESLEEHLFQSVTTSLGEIRSSGFFPMMRALAARPPASRGPARFPASYLTDPEDTIVPRFPRGGVRIAVVGGDVSHSMQLWALTHHGTVSVDAWC
jgi:hypothetical protein